MHAECFKGFLHSSAQIYQTKIAVIGTNGKNKQTNKNEFLEQLHHLEQQMLDCLVYFCFRILLFFGPTKTYHVKIFARKSYVFAAMLDPGYHMLYTFTTLHDGLDFRRGLWVQGNIFRVKGRAYMGECRNVNHGFIDHGDVRLVHWYVILRNFVVVYLHLEAPNENTQAFLNAICDGFLPKEHSI